jgi:hypothetical protein
MPFNFTEFARQIYDENPRGDEENFLLPALYGGELGHGDTSGKFKALFVFIAPSVSFTEKRWTPCTTPEEAIKRHRESFFQWAFTEPKQTELADLFRCLVSAPVCASSEDFFRRVYVTDIWKDADDKKKLKRDNPDCLRYGQYWRSKLQTEIGSIATDCVIFVGPPPRKSGWDHVPKGTARFWLDFLTQSNKELFKEQARQILSLI